MNSYPILNIQVEDKVFTLKFSPPTSNGLRGCVSCAFGAGGQCLFNVKSTLPPGGPFQSREDHQSFIEEVKRRFPENSGKDPDRDLCGHVQRSLKINAHAIGYVGDFTETLAQQELF